jgi:hypothetical protein
MPFARARLAIQLLLLHFDFPRSNYVIPLQVIRKIDWYTTLGLLYLICLVQGYTTYNT